MEQAKFEFYGNLNDFLPPEQQQVEFTHYFKARSSVKDMIESLGVPHPEVGLILVNRVSVDFSYLVQQDDRVQVYPVFAAIAGFSSQVRPKPLQPIRFVLDVHLGKLATYLRLLGFDVWYRNDTADEELANLSHQQQRVLLTQDRGLLKRKIVTYGYFVRSQDPQQQVVEVLQRYQLMDAVAPLTRCLRCNGSLHAVDKELIQAELPPLTRLFYNEFAQCQQCQKIYWKGAHFDRMQQLIQDFSVLSLGESSDHILHEVSDSIS
jgi:uncharacterized protein